MLGLPVLRWKWGRALDPEKMEKMWVKETSLMTLFCQLSFHLPDAIVSLCLSLVSNWATCGG